jgi:hypothetical protein
MRPEQKHRAVRAFEKYVENPPIKMALRLGIPPPVLALLETTDAAPSARPGSVARQDDHRG